MTNEEDRAGGVHQVIVVSGGPDAAEMAAVTAVLTGVLEELAAEHGRRELDEHLRGSVRSAACAVS